MQDNNQEYHAMLPIGAELQMGKYRVERYLSSGGFGNTYVVRNVEFDEVFAMKEFFMKGVNERDKGDSTHISVSNPTNTEQFEQQREKFKREARRLRSLHNRHLVQVHDLFEENGTAYYVMDFVEGESLSALLKRTGQPLSEREGLRILSEVLDGLEEVHKQKIWHLDLKPGNIMLDKEGRAVLIDFGASKQLTSSGYATSTVSMCYTPGYAPSEQVDQNIERIGPWTDLYALGATLYNILTRNNPPAISDLTEANAFRYPAAVSSNTRKLIEWMMNPSRQRRPQSIDSVRNYLSKMPEAAFLRSANSAETVVGPQQPSRPPQQPQQPRQPQQQQQVYQQPSSGQPLRPVYVKPKSGMSPWLKAFLILGGIFAFLGVIGCVALVAIGMAMDDSSDYDSYDWSDYNSYDEYEDDYAVDTEAVADSTIWWDEAAD